MGKFLLEEGLKLTDLLLKANHVSYEYDSLEDIINEKDKVKDYYVSKKIYEEFIDVCIKHSIGCRVNDDDTEFTYFPQELKVVKIHKMKNFDNEYPFLVFYDKENKLQIMKQSIEYIKQ